MHGKDRAASAAANILDVRRARSRFLPPELFGEPAWDLLLELFVADAKGQRLTARNVSGSASVAPSVMTRWLKHLSQVGLIVGDGSGDLDDELTLSAKALGSIEEMLAVAQKT